MLSLSRSFGITQVRFYCHQTKICTLTLTKIDKISHRIHFKPGESYKALGLLYRAIKTQEKEDQALVNCIALHPNVNCFEFNDRQEMLSITISGDSTFFFDETQALRRQLFQETQSEVDEVKITVKTDSTTYVIYLTKNEDPCVSALVNSRFTYFVRQNEKTSIKIEKE